MIERFTGHLFNGQLFLFFSIPQAFVSLGAKRAREVEHKTKHITTSLLKEKVDYYCFTYQAANLVVVHIHCQPKLLMLLETILREQ